MMMSEAPESLINLLAEISNRHGIFMNLCMSLRQPHFQNGSLNEVRKCIQVKILDKNQILKCLIRKLVQS